MDTKKHWLSNGLSNENLKEAQYFNCEVYNLIVNFINRQTAPSCFVAYNGNNYDYPIFLSELKNIEKNFSEEILSIDMLKLVKDFYSRKQSSTKGMNTVQTTTTNPSSNEVSILLNDGYDKILSDALDSIMNTNFNDYNKNDTSPKTEKTIIYSDSLLNIPQSSNYKKMQEINEKTPKNQIIKLEHSYKNFQNKKGYTVRRKLDFTNSQPINFKLGSIYKHIFGKTLEGAHNAENDCLTMIRCAIKLGNFFLEWTDCNAVPLINHTKQRNI
ncbi:hypothetical protein WN51_03042 [Melipona quadrifasciata]|uniref:Exonuclease domain-containing protein n=1 Tax=Melipona quadrifasciata TaxID=166423 RepID=A0A0M8ZVP1_9HYME|nr:hypothetical protein WN51_03042 [Melipona quadrifasciata]